MKNQKHIIIVIALLLIAGAAVLLFKSTGSEVTNDAKDTVAPTESAIDVVATFYNNWLDSVQFPTSDPYTDGLSTDPVLSADAQAYLAGAEGGKLASGHDPVLCLVSAPQKVRSKLAFGNDSNAKVLVVGRGAGDNPSEYAEVSLEAVDGAWQISGIVCVSGESAPEREFTFDREGFLLKGVPPVLNEGQWYIVFEENGQSGHTAPLFFDAESQCIDEAGTEGVCDPNTFINPSNSYIRGTMGEAGVQVKHIEILPVE